MKRMRKFLISALLGASIGVSAVGLAACDMFEGSYELTDFIVNTSGVVTTYEINDEVSLDGLTMTAIFSDDSQKTVELKDVKIMLGEEDITANLSKITESVGSKTITIVYTTEYGTKSKTLTFTVTEEEVVLPVIASYTAPAFIATFQNSIDKATDDGASNDFESNFFTTTNAVYTVGADNAFKFVPDAMDDDANDIANVIVDTTVEMKVEGEYVALVKSSVEGSQYVYEYKYNDTLMVVENAAKNEFDFAAEAVDNVFAISVMPDSAVYELEDGVAAIEFEMKVVSGYNVYNAKELSVMDNTGRPEWQSIKAEYGLTDVVTSGIVLHDSIAVTKADIPEAFMYTLSNDYQINYKLGEETGSPETFGLDRTFLWDKYTTSTEGDCNDGYPDLYVRKLAAGESFNFYGNFFDLDLSALPLVASFHSDATSNLNYVTSTQTEYGNDFSNTTFLRVVGDQTTTGEADETCRFENVALRGNADTNGLLVTDGTTGYQKDTLVYCGGIIFTKMKYISAEAENVRTYKFFITFFGDCDVALDFNKTKVYDSASNAMYVWERANVTISQSYWQRAGGPLILVQHNDWDTRGAATMATVTISEDSVMEAYVTGDEAWFQSVNAQAIVAGFKSDAGINGILKGVNKAMFNTDGKMNLITLIMSDGTDPTDAIGALDVQGYVSYGDAVLDRVTPTQVTETTKTVGYWVHDIPAPYKDAIKAAAEEAKQTGDTSRLLKLVSPIFNFGSSVYYFAGRPEENGFGYLDPTLQVSTNNGYNTMKAAAEDADKFTLNYGGFGLLLGMFDWDANIQ